MYLSNEDINILKNRLVNLLKKTGIIFIHEPNGKAEKYLDSLSHPVHYNLIEDLLINHDCFLKKNYYDILYLRRITNYFIKALKMVFKERNNFATKISNFLYFCIINIEHFLSILPIGCDTKYVIIKSNINED